MYKRGNGEVTLAASASTGQTRWEQGNSTAFRSAYPDSGHGPFATPLVLADRVVTAGVTGRIECERARTARCSGLESCGAATVARASTTAIRRTRWRIATP